MKKFIAALLAVLMIFTLCSCTGKKDVALVISGTEIDSEILTYYLDKIISRPTDYEIPENPANKDIRNAAINECKKYLAANTRFRDNGLSLSSADKVEISENVNNFWLRFENHYNEIGVSKQTLTKIFTSEAYAEALFAETYDKGVNDAAAEKVLQDYFYNNYISFRTVCAYYTAADGVTEMTQLEKNKLIESFEKLKTSADADKLSEAANELGYSLSSSTLLKKGADGYYEDFFEKVYNQADDTVQIIVYDEYIFAVWKESLRSKGEGVYSNYRSSCISDLYSTRSEAEIAETIGTMTVEEKGGKIDRIMRKLK